MDSDESNDPRHVELTALSAIYPEIVVDPVDPYTFSLELPVHPSKTVRVLFPAAALGPAIADVAIVSQPRDHTGLNGHDDYQADAPREDVHDLSHLPSVQLHISLPEGYPSDRPPLVELGTSPSWIPSTRVQQLVAECARLWDDLDHDSVVFSYIDYLQQASETAFDVVDEKGTLIAETQHKIAILDYDISAKRAAFEKETFDCGVCLDPKKGAVCHRMLDCGHVFCVACLRDFYNNAIMEGSISSVRCLAPNCAKEREQAASKSRPDGASAKKKQRQKLLSPSELLQIPLEQDVVKRYVTLRYKSELESDKNTIYCPRKWCNGAARSKKHKKPHGLEFAETSDDSDNEDVNRKSRPYDKTAELLAVCEDCGFAFCSRCYVGWHGEFYRCTARRDQQELTAEEKASLEYVQLHTTPCPTCAAPAQKTHGCNHMVCGRQGCGTHFCYLCSSWLDPSNPYSHYNQQPNGRVTSCYMRLWELEEGDGNDVGLEFAGGAGAGVPRPARQPVEAEHRVQPAHLIPEIEEAEGDGPNDGPAQGVGNDRRGPHAANHEHDNERGVALEAPLVLRIAADPPARAAPPAVPNAPAAGGQQAGHGHHNQRGRGGRDGRNAGRGRGGQHNAPAARDRGGRRARGGAAAREPEMPELIDAEDGPDGLNEAQRAWVRQFVQMALNDQEDEFDSDSDEEVFWIR